MSAATSRDEVFTIPPGNVIRLVATVNGVRQFHPRYGRDVRVAAQRIRRQAKVQIDPDNSIRLLPPMEYRWQKGARHDDSATLASSQDVPIVVQSDDQGTYGEDVDGLSE